MPANTPSPSKLSTRLYELRRDAAAQADVVDVRMGLGYTAVLLADGRCGVAYTFRDAAQGGCTVMDGLRPLAGRPASDLLELLLSSYPLEAAVGLACANALGNRHNDRMHRGDILGQLDVGPDDRVAMIGHFRPLVKKLAERARELIVFERVDRPEGFLRPTAEAIETLPDCQVALVTSTAIINHSVDELLAAAGRCREVVMLGASTPLAPEIFENTPVTQLSGALVREPAQVLQVLSEGGGMKLFSPYVDKVSLPIRNRPGE